MDDGIVMVLVMARVAPTALALWAMGRAFVPAAVAASLGFALTAALWPSAGGPPPAADLVLVFLRELCIGATFAIALSLALSSARWALALGLSRVEHVASVLGTVYALAAISLTLSLGGHRAVVIGLAESYHDAKLSVGEVELEGFALGAAQLVTDALATALALALPLLLSAFLIDALLALVSRLLLPRGAALSTLVRPLALTVICAGLLVPIASEAPSALRRAIAEARALTRGRAR